MQLYNRDEIMEQVRLAKEEQQGKNRRKKVLIKGIALLILSVMVMGVEGLKYVEAEKAAKGKLQEEKVEDSQEHMDKDSIEVATLVDKEEIVIPEEEKEVSITITAVGDCTLGSDPTGTRSGSFAETFEKQGADYFFKEVKSIFEQDDITLINLEGVIAENIYARADKQFAFRGDPNYVDIMSNSSVEAANIANNHSKDFGWTAYGDMKEHLTEAGVKYFGYDNIAYFEKEGIKVALIGVYELGLREGAIEEVEIRVKEAKEEGADLIITSFHWGVESAAQPQEFQVKLAKIAIDAGSDLIIGHHPHVIQGIEEYNGKYIAYSLANFSFGGNRNPSDKDTFIYQQTFNFKGKEIVDTNVNLIPCKVSSVSDRNNYQPIVATGEAKEAIVKKIKDRSMTDISPFIAQ